jgi:cell wall-associated NlpC family hydrolase
MSIPVGVAAASALPRLWKYIALATALAVTFGACLLGLGAAVLVQLVPNSSPAAAVSAPGDVGAVVLFAERQIGQPYLWGGEGAGGFDCSGLVQAAYASVGVSLPRVAQDQFDLGPHLAATQQPEPGDLVFFGSSDASITHVGIVVNNTQMIDAPHTGAVVRVESFHWSDYIGATRPGQEIP